MRSSARFPIAIVLLASLGASAQAQIKPNIPPPVSADPSVTTAAFGDWTLRCEKPASEKTQHICEAVQTVQLQNQPAPIAQIAFGRSSSSDPVRLVVVLPVNVLFPSSVKMGLGDKDPESLDLAWRRCLPVGCFAENATPDAAIRRWRGETGQGRISYKDAAGRDMALPISFRGMAQALDALARQ